MIACGFWEYSITWMVGSVVGGWVFWKWDS